MGKFTHNDVLDAPLNKVATATTMVMCSQQPTNRTQAVTTYALSSVTPTFTGPADGDTSGRKITVNATTGAGSTNGTGTHVALCDGATLLYVTTCDPLAITAGANVDFGEWEIEFADPA